MSNLTTDFDSTGYSVVDGLLSAAEVDEIERELVSSGISTAGTRDLLKQGWCGTLAEKLKYHPSLFPCMPENAAAVQCTFFDKSEDKN